MPEGKSAAIATREKSVLVGPDEGVDRPAGHLDHLLRGLEQVKVQRLGSVLLVRNATIG